jgi:hypothetical protein
MSEEERIYYDPKGTSGFDKHMVKVNDSDSLENKTNKLTDEEFEQKFGLSPKTTSNANGGRKRKSKRRRSTKRSRGSKRSRSLKRRK